MITCDGPTWAVHYARTTFGGFTSRDSAVLYLRAVLRAAYIDRGGV